MWFQLVNVRLTGDFSERRMIDSPVSVLYSDLDGRRAQVMSSQAVLATETKHRAVSV